MNEAFQASLECATNLRNEYYCPEHLLYAFLLQSEFQGALLSFGVEPDDMREELFAWLQAQEHFPEPSGEEEQKPSPSVQMAELISSACHHTFFASREQVDVPHFTYAMLGLEESWAAYMLKKYLKDQVPEFMSHLISFYDIEAEDLESSLPVDDDLFDGSHSLGDEELYVDDDGEEDDELNGKIKRQAWRQLVTCVNDLVDQHNPLIGREQELERTLQVLCRKEKNNPLHVGEPGVGKTALVYGLAARIERGDVPERLKGCRIYQMDMGTMLAGTQYRGDFEKRIKRVMEGVAREGNGIVYIDEIHNMIGAGRGSDGGPDASNMLKPYLESGDIRFIGSTTYEEYNRHFARQRGIVRRFQQIDIAEPSQEEAIQILKGLRQQYETFHHVSYPDDVLEYAVRQSARLVSDRFLPDKAIDLIDEAGAAVESVALQSVVSISKADIADVLAKTCKVDALAIAKDDDYQQLENLAPRMLSQIYGQDEAIRQVVEAVQMSRAGLLDDNKPLASLLFVGPTGVGKTEVARVLAKELGIELIRFDMSEYTEKHAVAKLIGSPAGYVGYEDGGLLTDAIRKSPNAVLLLDEIEKAHQDIYNILLQVMDYARLTDNKGRKADFRNVVLIMTSNAGAQFAGQSIGFSGSVSRGEAMMKQVKRTFKPEFLNRLSGTVVFHDMDKEMATLILKKKLREVDVKLEAKNVRMSLNPDAFEYLLKEGFTTEYGAREMDRVIAQQLKPLLMREILFGSLKNGGEVTIGIINSQLSIIN